MEDDPNHMARVSSLAAGVKVQLLDLNSYRARLTAIVALDRSRSDCCARVFAVVGDYLGNTKKGLNRLSRR